MKQRLPTTVATALLAWAGPLGCGPRQLEQVSGSDANVQIGNLDGGGGSGGGGSGADGRSGSGGVGGGISGGAGRDGGFGGAAGVGGSAPRPLPPPTPPVRPPPLPSPDGPRPDLAGYDVLPNPDRPPLPDGQFYYPSLDGKLCGSDEYVLPRFTADVLVVLDRSGSMGERSGGGGGGATKWDDAAAAVKATVAGSSNLSWGLKLFPTGAQRCAASSTVEVPVGGTSAAAMGSAIDRAGPPMATLGEGTPTAATVQAATAYLKSLTFPFPKYIVLATDGAPTCQGDGSDMRDDARAIAAIEAAAAAGFKTYVIGIATAATDNDTLNRMAVAGGTARPGATRYFSASNRAELTAALDTITASLITCVFPLANRPPDPGFVAVTVGGKPLPRDLSHAQGWDYLGGDTAIQVYGMACESLKRGTVQGAGIFYGCPQ
jgi:hypothetical protein